MFQALAEAGEGLKADPAVRVVVLSGEGGAFCAGLDFAASRPCRSGRRRRMPPTAAPESLTPGGDHAPRPAGGVGVAGAAGAGDRRRARPALGGGLQIALGADLRIVAPDAKLSVLRGRAGASSPT